MPSRVFGCLCLFLLAAAPLAVADVTEPGVAGAVIQMRGAALVNHSESSDNLSIGARILVGDRIVTGRNARVGLKMIDGSVVRLGADTEFVINEYHYKKSAHVEQGSARLELIKGVFRAITGAIGKLKERDFQVKTPVAAIGIRGTDFWGGVYFSQALDVALLGGGGIYVENAAGRVDISDIGNGTTVLAADKAPTPSKQWPAQKVSAAQGSVAWEESDTPPQLR